MRRVDYRNYYKGHIDKIKGVGGGRVGGAFGLGGVDGCGENGDNST